MSNLVDCNDNDYPPEWSRKTIGELATRVGSGITPTGGSEIYTESGIIFIRSQNVTFKGLDLADVAFIDKKIHDSMLASEVFPFDVLVNITGASIGRCCFLPDNLGQANVNQHVCAIRLPNPNVADAKFLSSVLSSAIGQNQIFRLNAGGNREGLNYQQLRAFEVPWPSRFERSKIASILTTVDNLIEKTEALIAKYQAIKQGMMHDLFTRGVEEHDQLRPPYDEAPELYKESELGWIPKEWEKSTLGAVCNWLSGGTPSKSNLSYWSGPIPWISPKDMKSFVISNGTDHISLDAAETGSRLVSAGAVLIVVRGMILAHSFPVGITEVRVAFNQDIKALVCDGPVAGRFLAHWLVAHTSKILRFVTESTHGTKRFDLTDLHTVPFGVPPLYEQEGIAARLDAFDAVRQSEVNHLAKLQTLKTGLMQDLLTGKVRVKVDKAEKVEV